MKNNEKALIEKNQLSVSCIDFSLIVMTYCDLLNEKQKFIISKQLFRSATSIGANAMEAQNSESKADFIHKLKIAAEEADEAQYWLILFERAADYPFSSEIVDRLESIQKMLTAILTSARKKSIK